MKGQGQANVKTRVFETAWWSSHPAEVVNISWDSPAG
jgi:hypothetical protein